MSYLPADDEPGDAEAEPEPEAESEAGDAFSQYPETVDPVRFYVRRGGEIVACGCSFPFPHDAIVVSQGARTTVTDSLPDARDLVGGDEVEFLDGATPGQP